MSDVTTRRDFEGKVIWVTGASGALGHATATLLAQRGATVVASARSIEKSEFPGLSVDRLPVDVTDDGDVRRGFDTLFARHGRIDAVVTSTNVSTFGEFIDLSDDDWLTVIQAKLLGSVRPVRAALPALLAQQSGPLC
ncbi:SDR family oxidoreductase [Rhodobacter sp. 24-YEA-8]|uniref:SDR family oxidoreductase n=1 Tax=Rhodobacter sp. 24-YEA-8 TaxID=1884310 RepID=UPI001C0D4127|nr:SDR family NAD(P)-dependent oxidoreductase [Rhodobacter sp. 24-YEA-8]